MLKRACDLVGATLGLALLWPLFFCIALLIRLDSPGPILYRGIRTGRFGRPFRIVKFRTMVVDAERLGGGSTAHDDPRVTRVGRFLRDHKLDELPQLWNVLVGDMSLVGPRPELPQYTAQYSDEEREILSMRPGITDIASIEFIHLGEILGNDNPDLIYETRVRPVKNALRVQYVRTQSIGGDFVLIMRTLAKLIAR